MLAILIIIVALILGMFVGQLVLKDAGYVLISYGGYTLETSVWALVCFTILLSLIMYVLFRFVRSLTHGQQLMARWGDNRRRRRTVREILNAILESSNGDWNAYANSLVRASADSDAEPLLLHQAAEAANRGADIETRNEVLQRLKDRYPDSSLAVDLSKARMLIDAGHAVEGVALLQELQIKHPKSEKVLELLANGYGSLKDWSGAQQTIQSLRKAKSATVSRLRPIEIESWEERFRTAEELGATSEHTQELWKTVPREFRDNTKIVSAYVDSLVHQGDHAKAHSALKQAINRNWNTAWIQQYADIDDDPAAQFEQARTWLRSHANDADLLLVLGKLASKLGEFGQAREFFETSLRIRESDRAHLELAHLSSKLGEHGRSEAHLARMLSTTGQPLLPARSVVES